MFGSGQTRRYAPPPTTSGLPSTADITHRDHHFRKVPTTEAQPYPLHEPGLSPKPDISHCSATRWSAHAKALPALAARYTPQTISVPPMT
jgi:hypothetical protein